MEDENRIHPNIIVHPFQGPNQPHPVQQITTPNNTTCNNNGDSTISPPNHLNSVQTASNSYYPTLPPQDPTKPYPYPHAPENSHHVPIHHPDFNAFNAPPH